MDAPEPLRRFVPQWDTLFLSLHGTPPETLTRLAGSVGWALRVLQAEAAPREVLEAVLREAVAGLESLPEAQAGQWLRVTWYLLLLLFHRREESEYTQLGAEVQARARQSKFRQREAVRQMGLTMAQVAEQRGEARGAAGSWREALRLTLERRFGGVPPRAVAPIEAADAPTLRAWLDAALTAESLSELPFAGDSPRP